MSRKAGVFMAVLLAWVLFGTAIRFGERSAAFASDESKKAASSALPYIPVVTPDRATLPWRIEDGVKVFHLVAEPIKQEFAPGLVMNCWGYNGCTPGPTIEAVEGDRVRILVTNNLAAPTSIHWHGIFVPSGMDGVGGLTQRHIQPGETYAYEFTLRQHGTFMYHPHLDEMTQIAMGTMGFFIIHPREPENPPIDRDFAIFLHEWSIEPGTATPDPIEMTDFNYFTFNGKAFPGTSPLVVRQGQRVRIRLANLSMDNHPIHIHGYAFKVTATDGGAIPASAQWPMTTVDVPVGATRDIEFVAHEPGDWAFHCHKTHHMMSGMVHELPNMIGVDQGEAEEKIRTLLPGYMAMGEAGMAGMHGHASGVTNYIGMGSMEGPFGTIEMGGMFTIIKVRDGIIGYEDPGWYEHPEGTVAKPVAADGSGD
ncbi:MAG: copper oxidase [Candidatus Abyssobacteria bacterium SURF_17]|uniref:Copper oxidase n=1 Tax=Candidatus Abyssobacteria bacterium SURF_17 TaxID=2093361 RepID=A0A419F953_9BACT|nr:MAG: copper oxidase [Candidatus Abyssubacteria bacterium SURF_17]